MRQEVLLRELVRLNHLLTVGADRADDDQLNNGSDSQDSQLERSFLALIWEESQYLTSLNDKFLNELLALRGSKNELP